MTPPHPLAHELVARHARDRPDAVAVELDGTRLTYRRLDALATAFARGLLARGLAPEDIVAVDARRTPETLVAMLGAWRAGGAYLPLDPALPEVRRQAMLADAAPRLHVTDQADAPGAVPYPDLEADGPDQDAPETPPLPAVTGDHLAYVLYTSGSTGTPKGVLVEHGGVAQRAGVQLVQFGILPGDRVSQYCSLAWDASMFEIMLAWGAGATLCLVPDGVRRSGAGITRFLADIAVDIAFFPPSVLAAMPAADLPRLRAVMLGGDRFPGTLVDRWGGARRFLNLYGPTETTMWVSTDECRPGEPVTLGHPVPGTRMVAVDGQGRALPPGETGELCIGGTGLARGYLHRPEATAERFVEDPERPGERLYRSGDRGRVLPDGRIEMHGRMDDQVKIRGMRVELGEVEAALADLPGVQACAVATDGDARGDARLVAYVHMQETPHAVTRPAAAALRRRLREGLLGTLPAGLVPAVFVETAPLPTLPNGKLDRNALPAAPAETPSVDLVELPRSDLERLVAGLWSRELGRDALGIHENVFELGAHSLLATHVQAALEGELGRPVDIVLLFEHPTVAGLAAALGPASPDANLASGGAARGAARRTAMNQRRRAPRRGPGGDA